MLRAITLLVAVVVLAGLSGEMQNAQAVMVRDALTGEGGSGGQPGPFLLGTGSNTLGTTQLSAFPRNIPVGTLDLEADYGSGWVPLLTYCFESNQGFSFGLNPPDAVGHNYGLIPLAAAAGVSAQDIEYIEILWSNAFAGSIVGQVEAAAFQYIVWELVEDTSIDLLADNLRLDTSHAHTSNVHTLASAWLDNIIDGTWTTRTTLYVLTSPTSQDILTTIPEPATLAFLAAGSLLMIRRRRTAR